LKPSNNQILYVERSVFSNAKKGKKQKQLRKQISWGRRILALVCEHEHKKISSVLPSTRAEPGKMSIVCIVYCQIDLNTKPYARRNRAVFLQLWCQSFRLSDLYLVCVIEHVLLGAGCRFSQSVWFINLY
jgi:hypothetical protein